MGGSVVVVVDVVVDVVVVVVVGIVVVVNGMVVVVVGGSVVVIGIVEGAIIGAGFAILMSEASITKELADVLELLFGFLIPGVNWEVAAIFVLGLVGYVIFYTLFTCFRIVRLAGGLAAAIGGCVAIYMFITLFVNIEEWKARDKSTTAPATMPLIKVLMLKLFKKIAPRFQLFEWYY